ncbi:flap endonuclease-1 [Candidatus Micrarchaeota archaeon]|nr:flap endonuclease-1 [Candidatus Micrarchaeota archaeon]
MGVHIADILIKHELTLSEIQGKVAVDAYNTLYQFLSIIRQKDGTPLMDSHGRVTSHLSGLFYRTCNLLEKGIRPVFVFDGKPSDLKRHTLESREERKQTAEKKFEEAKKAGREDEMRLYAQQTVRLRKHMVEESKQLCRLMGIPVVQAKSEGEAQCAIMCREGLVDATASQDYDSLLFGSPVLIKNITIAGRRKLPRRNRYTEIVPERLDLQENLNALGITYEKLVWLGLLAGTDFDQGIKGIGAKKALKLVREHDSMDAILNKLGVEMDWMPVEALFRNPPATPVTKDELKLLEPHRENIISFMMERDFSKERVQSALARAFKEPTDTTQNKLSKWL